ncbi:MAG: DUF3794 domain-containing protein [Clostridia bacterium]|nr:DUF3794 domain-containing protein [Clostridia bacterium]
MNTINRTNYNTNETLWENSAEQSLDLEINLPEYCGDITKILQCFAFPHIHSCSQSAENLQIEGEVLVRVLYVSEGEIFSYEQAQAFSKKMECRDSTIGAVADLSTYVQYINSRATGSRKIEVHGAFVIVAKLSACKESSVIESIEEADVQMDKDSLSACSARGSAAATVNVAQVIDIGTDKAPMKSIIRNTAVAEIVETKQVAGKILIKGELKVKTLYKSEENTVESIENVLALSQIMDIDGMDENSTVDIKLQLSSLDVFIKPSALGNMSLLDLQAAVNIYVCAYNCIDFPVLKDVYSTEYACNCTFKEVCVDKILSTLSKNYLHSFTVDSLGDIAKVIDVWCEDIRAKACEQEQQLVITGTLCAYVLYENLDGVIQLKSAESEFSFTEPLGEVSKVKCSPEAVLSGCDYVIRENGVEVRADIHVKAMIFDCISQKVIDDITMEETPLLRNNSLFIFYAHSGERLWNIASKFKTTVTAIQKENKIEKEVLEEDKPLLIWG